jgi:hypothetical protein
LKTNYNREKDAWNALPRIIREAVARYIFKSAIKSNVAIMLFRCEHRHWSKERMRSLFYEIIGLYQAEFFGKSISDVELIERYEKMLDIDFSKIDEVVEVSV